MLPFERLRLLARDARDDRGLVAEVASCLAEFTADPAELVLVCRRLLAHHPANGALWWLCARVVGAADPAAAARDAVRAVGRDRTADRLAAALPFPHDAPVLAFGLPEIVASALAERPDLDAVVVRPRRPDPGFRSRLAALPRPLRTVDAAEAASAGATHLLVEVLATSPTRALVPVGALDVCSGVPGATCWLVAPLDRILPERLFAVLADHLPDGAADLMAVAAVDGVVGPGGLDPPERLASRVECPAAPELLKV